MMMMAGRVVDGRFVVDVMMAVTMVVKVGSLVVRAHANIGEEHMLMVVMADDHVLNGAHRAGDGGLPEDEQKGDA